MHVGSLLLREARPADVDRLLTFRNNPAVNRFMLHTTVDPEKFRKDWLSLPDSDVDFSCVVQVCAPVEDVAVAPGPPLPVLPYVMVSVLPAARVSEATVMVLPETVSVPALAVE